MARRNVLLALSLALLVATQAVSADRNRGLAGDGRRNVPPPNAAARIDPNAGSCIQFISIFVPSHGGNYVVGLSFAYRDMNHDGRYTPGIDKMEVCVNCADACGFGP